MKRLILLLTLLLFLGRLNTPAQSLLDSLSSIVEQPLTPNYTEATFKAPRVINGHS